MWTRPSSSTRPPTWPSTDAAPVARPHDQVDALLHAYYRHVAPEDIVDRSDVDVYGALASHYKLALDRPQGTAQVRVFTPDAERARLVRERSLRRRGRRRRHAVPRRLADHGAVPAAARRARGHPPAASTCVRDIAGALQSVRPGRGRLEHAGGRGGPRVVDARRDRPDPRGRRPRGDRRPRPAGAARRARGGRGLGQDARPGRRRRRRAQRATRRPLDAEEVAAGRASCSSGSPTTTSRSSATASTASSARATTTYLRAIPGTGLGILRADQEMSESFGRLPETVKAKAREKTLLVLTKANSRSTVHRPAYLDYVGRQDVRRRRRGRSASAASSACSRARPTPSRCCASRC